MKGCLVRMCGDPGENSLHRVHCSELTDSKFGESSNGTEEDGMSVSIDGCTRMSATRLRVAWDK